MIQSFLAQDNLVKHFVGNRDNVIIQNELDQSQSKNFLNEQKSIVSLRTFTKCSPNFLFKDLNECFCNIILHYHFL